MRKSPLSTPIGGNGRNNGSQGWHSRDRRQQQQQQGFDGSGGSGYGQFQQGDVNYGSFTPTNNQSSPQQKGGDDFIPLGVSSPVNHRPRNNYGNWRGRGNPHRQRGTPPGQGFGNSPRGNFYQESPRSNSIDDSNSPKFYQRNYQSNHFGQRRPRQKDSHRHIDISNYLNVNSCLEDPWEKLMKNLDDSHSFNRDKNNCTASESSCGSLLVGDLNVKSESFNTEEDTTEVKIATKDNSEKVADDKTTITPDIAVETS